MFISRRMSLRVNEELPRMSGSGSDCSVRGFAVSSLIMFICVGSGDDVKRPRYDVLSWPDLRVLAAEDMNARLLVSRAATAALLYAMCVRASSRPILILESKAVNCQLKTEEKRRGERGRGGGEATFPLTGMSLYL